MRSLRRDRLLSLGIGLTHGVVALVGFLVGVLGIGIGTVLLIGGFPFRVTGGLVTRGL